MIHSFDIAHVPPLLLPLTHLIYLSLLRLNDLLSHALKFAVLCVLEVFRHIDSSLVMWYHRLKKGPIEIITRFTDQHIFHVCHRHQGVGVLS